MYNIQSASITHTGKVRGVNEDSVLESDGIFAVADGMGGHNAGEVASSMAVELIADYLGTGRDDSSGAQLLRESIESVNSKIHEKAASGPEFHDMGTTLTVVYFSDNTALIGNIGDSRAYLFRDGRMERLTRDDSLVARMVDAGIINEAEAGRHPQRNVILKALGVEPHIDFEVTGKEVRPGDLFLLSTDGLTSLVEDSEIEAVLGGSGDIGKKAKRLLKRALENGGTDNISIVVVLVGGQPGAGSDNQAGGGPRAKRKNQGRFFGGKRNL